MDYLTSIWQYIVPVFGGVTVAGIVSAIVYACLKGAFSRTINKINVKEISDKATEKGLEKIKNVSFTQSIQPLVESELKKIEETAKNISKEELIKCQEKFDKLVLVVEALAHYFDNSYGISENAKSNLTNAIESAKNEPLIVETDVVVEIKEEKPKEEKKAKKSTSNDVLL